MKTSYTVEEWANFGLFEDVPVLRIEQVVYALNYTLGWIDKNQLDAEEVSSLPLIIMTIATIIDVTDMDLDKILSDAHIGLADHLITFMRYGGSMEALESDFEFSQEFIQKVIKEKKTKINYN